ncbi:MAG TPA: isoprenylcysteine carboxylmethyltransferase family protein [Casimicrobiaceae bacterium]
MPSVVLVLLQFAALIGVVLPWGAAAFSPWGFAPLALATGVGAWTLAHNRLGNFSVLPEPKAGARLVVTGPYAYVRHPMYLAVLLFGLGFLVGWRGGAHAAAFVLLGAVLHVKSRREEMLLAQRFPEYADYARRTRRLVPFVL